MESVSEMSNHFEIGEMTFEVVDLPGHCPDTMVGFYEKHRKWFFSADCVPLPTKKKMATNDENVVQVIATMKKILDMDIEVLFDSHRGAIIEPAEHIRKRIDWLTELQSKARELHEEGLSIDEIKERLDLREPWYLGATNERFGVSYLIRSLIYDT